MAKGKRRKKKRGGAAAGDGAAAVTPTEAPSEDGHAGGAGGSDPAPVRTKRARSTREARLAVSEPAPAPAPKPERPWWLLVAIVGVIAVVTYLQMKHASEREVVAASDDRAAAGPAPERLRVHVVNRYPHQRDAFTQGLLWHEGALYESTGLRGRSTLRRVALESGEVLASRDLDRRLFAEGLARVDELLYQLTWEEGECHVWTLDGFEHRRTFAYDGEGWGLCYDGEHLVMSDGSARLTFRDPETFRIRRVVNVRDRGRAIDDLNELECVDGAVWANVWQSDRIVRIDPASGRVTGVVDASGLLSADDEWGTDVLNGIAWMPDRGHFAITGKRWPHLFEVDFVPASAAREAAE